MGGRSNMEKEQKNIHALACMSVAYICFLSENGLLDETERSNLSSLDETLHPYIHTGDSYEGILFFKKAGEEVITLGSYLDKDPHGDTTKWEICLSNFDGQFFIDFKLDEENMPFIETSNKDVHYIEDLLRYENHLNEDEIFLFVQLISNNI